MGVKSDIAKQVERIGKLMELQGANPFKVRAYSNGARVIDGLDEDLGTVIAEGRLGDLKGIGDALQQKIIDIYNTGTCPQLEKLESEIPEGVQEMLNIKGLGAKKIAVIWKEMEILSLGDLLYACNENRLVEVKGFGEKTQETIRQAVEYYMANQGNFHYAKLYPLAEELLSYLKSKTKSDLVSLTGEVRRKMPILNKIEIIADGSIRADVEKAIEGNKNISEVNKGDAEIAFDYEASAIPAVVKIGGGNFYQDLISSTGGEAHDIDTSKASGESEEAIYESLGMAWIPPELRDNKGIVDQAAAGKIPTLVEWNDLKGTLHNHSKWSDGLASLADMAKACKELGLEYLGISDHSKSAFYANGLSAERVAEQHAEIDELNSSFEDFKIFKGIESDILYDGSLDYEDDVLASFDFIVASVHSQLKMDEEKATSRLINAIENPYTTILGHPTGRLLLMRKGYPIDHKKVIDACAANGVSIEINANPYRLDIDWTWIPYCLEKGIMISINPDAHKVAGLEDMHWGIAAARKGGLSADMTLNALDRKQIEEYFLNKKP